MDLKKHILEKTEALFLKYGLKSVTMDDIARKLGISKKTLYQYVDNKSDLISKVLRSCMEEELIMMEKVKKDSSDAIEEMLYMAKFAIQQLRRYSPTLVYDLQKYYGNIWTVLMKQHRVHAREFIKENIETGIKQGIYRADINADILSKLYIMSTFSVVDEELFPLKDYNKENLFIEFIKYHIHGIASEKGLDLIKQYTERERIAKNKS